MRPVDAPTLLDANASSPAHRYGLQVRIKNTFLHVAEQKAGSEVEPKRRSRTQPPLEQGRGGAPGFDVEAPTDAEQQAAESSSAAIQRHLHRLATASGAPPIPAWRWFRREFAALPAPLDAKVVPSPVAPSPETAKSPTGRDTPASSSKALARPRKTEEANVVDPAVEKQPQTIVCSQMADGSLRTFWVVDARKLDGSDQQVVSPAILLEMRSGARMRFKISLSPKRSIAGRRVSCFKRAMGKGFITVKCEGDDEGHMTPTPAVISLKVTIGSSTRTLLPGPRGLPAFDFSRRAVCNLPKDQEEWDFRAVVDEKSQTFVVCVDLFEVVSSVTA